MALDKLEVYRLLVYVALFCAWTAYEVYTERAQWKFVETQMELLDSSSEVINMAGLLQGMDLSSEGGNEVEIDFSGIPTVQLAMEDYIRERQSTYQTGFVVPDLADSAAEEAAAGFDPSVKAKRSELKK